MCRLADSGVVDVQAVLLHVSLAMDDALKDTHDRRVPHDIDDG
jgi:hypothetical protein